MLLLLLFAFLSGLVTILAPCIWPLLPLILSSSATSGSKFKSLGITVGIMASFSLLTLTLSYIVYFFHFNPDILRLLAVVIITFLGLSLIIPKLSDLFETYVGKLSGKAGVSNTNRSGFLGGFITGLSLGIVWTPCAGPILATIATLSGSRAVNFSLIIVTLVYVLGIGIPLFLFSYAGAKFISKSKNLSPYTHRIQQIFGIIMLLTALLIFTNYDKILEAKLLNLFPSYSNLLLQLETNPAVSKGLSQVKGNNNIDKSSESMPFPHAGTLPNLGKAPDFSGITKWLNTSKPLSLADLRGKVVLVDFWTYTCINCIRTLPHVTSWYEKYKNQGFVVVGVHTPEFEFEKETANVENALKQFGINYPVAQDNNYSTWNAYNNEYWPAEYLLDINGNIRRTHFGEGEYDLSEKAIQQLLNEAGKKTATGLSTMPDQTPVSRISPETYIGSARMEYYYPGGNLSNGSQNFSLSPNLPQDNFSLGGNWTINNEYSTTETGAVLEYNFNANKVFLVMRPPQNTKAKVKVLIDGQLATPQNSGSDVQDGLITIDSDRLYNLVDLKGNTANHLLRLEFDSGIAVYAFTFG